MIRTLIATAALAIGFVGQAGAVTTVLVDDFEQHDQFVWGAGGAFPTTETSIAMGNGLTRTVTFLYSGPAVPVSALETSWLTAGPGNDSGHLSMANDGITSTGTVSWTLPAGFIPGTGSGALALTFNVVASDLSVTATLKLGATTLGMQTYGGPGLVSFALGSGQDVINASGGTLALVFTGPASYDMTIDNVQFQTPVPENSTALMLLAGLLATAGMRHRFARRETRV